MDEKIKKDIISVLHEAINYIQTEDYLDLKELSDHTIDDASIVQDQDSIQIAVIVYALSKILDRTKEEHQTLSINILKSLERAHNSLLNDDEEEYRKEIKKVFSEISQKDERLLLFVQNVVEKANIVKGGSLYKHGLSIGRASEILGITQWDLMSFVGKTKIADVADENITDIKKRLDFAKKLFKVL